MEALKDQSAVFFGRNLGLADGDDGAIREVNDVKAAIGFGCFLSR